MTITGTILNTDGTPYVGIVSFVSLSTPFSSGSNTVTDKLVRKQTSSTGALPSGFILSAGYYTVETDRDEWTILVPGGTSSADISTLEVAVAGTFTGGDNLFGVRFGMFNVLDYGAKLDGTTEDHTAINAAITAANAAGGGDVVIPGGKTVLVGGQYGMATPATIELRNKANVRLRIGSGTRIMVDRSTFEEGAHGCAIYVRESTNCLIEGGSVEGDGSDNYVVPLAFGLMVVSSNRITVRDLLATGWVADGIYVGNHSGTPSELITIDNCRSVDNCNNGLAITWASGVKVIGGDYSSNGSADGASMGIDIEPDNSGGSVVKEVHDVTIIGPTCAENVRHGIQVHAWTGSVAQDIRITSAHFRENLMAGFVGSNCQRVSVENCTALDGGYNDFQFYASSSNCSITGCRSEDCANNGVYAYGSTDLRIIGNTVLNAAGSGIELPNVGVAKRCVVENNTIRGCYDGIISYGYFHHISANTVIGNQRSGIAVTGLGCVLNDNTSHGNGTLADNTYSNIVTTGRGHVVNGNNVQMTEVFHVGTLDAVGTGTVTLPSDALAEDDYYNDATIETLTGTGSGQTATITDYVGSTRVATVTFAVAVDNTTTYRITKGNRSKYGVQVASEDTVYAGNAAGYGGATAGEFCSGSTSGTAQNGQRVLTGNVVCSPDYGLGFKTGPSTTVKTFYVGTDGNTHINSPASGDFYFKVNGTNVARLHNSGIWYIYGGSAPQVRSSYDPNTGLDFRDNDELGVVCGGAGVARFDASAVAGDTRFMLWDVTAGALRRVTVGASDSGGTGYKVLRVVN